MKDKDPNGNWEAREYFPLGADFRAPWNGMGSFPFMLHFIGSL